MKKYEEVNNLLLLLDNLYHINFELKRKNKLFFRIAKESYLVLNRVMIEALKGSANIAITGRPSRNREYIYTKDGKNYYQIRKEELSFCKKAWRFSSPNLLINYQVPVEQESDEQPEWSDFLKAFYDLLSMIQTEIFMQNNVFGKPVKVEDEEMKKLEWLHECVRNEFEHFQPKTYLVHRYSSIEASIVCLTIAHKILYESHNVLDKIPRGVKSNLKSSLNLLKRELKRIPKRRRKINSGNNPFNNPDFSFADWILQP